MQIVVKALIPIVRDLLATFVFVLLFWTEGVYVATITGITIVVVQTAWMHWKSHKMGALQWLSLALILFFGGLTIVFHKPHFIMMKPTFLWAALGAVFLRRDWMEPYLPPVVKECLNERQITLVGYAYAGLLFALAIANVLVVIFASPHFWAAYALIGPAIAQAVLMTIFYFFFRKQFAGAAA